MSDCQFDIDRQIRRSKLIDYVSGFGGMSNQQAEVWLDKKLTGMEMRNRARSKQDRGGM